MFFLILRKICNVLRFSLLSLIDCLITPKREGRVLGGFDAEIFLLSQVLEIVANESGLTLGASEVLRTTIVGARTELLQLFCTGIDESFLAQKVSELLEERHMHEDSSSSLRQHLLLTHACRELGKHRMGICD